MSTAILTNAFKEIFEELADKFSGEDFTKEDLMKEFLGKDLISKKEKKKKKKSTKPHKMSIRKFIMQDPDWKAKIMEKKDDGEGDGNFIKCTSIVIDEMDEDENDELQEKVDEINEKIASDFEKLKASDSSDDGSD